ncbi:hypothetical protein ACFQZZ_07090 [Nocardia sp. GCM10030253]|uniref:hypothetical protein n=1 Tax=Nocardia sp. GCM10030253 TaxID=3273404 RepID=UPI003634E1B6
MKLRRTGQITIGAVAIAAMLSLTACGSDDPKDPPKTPRTTTSAVASSNLPPIPSAADLNTALTRALDPSVPNADKLELVQGAEADPELPGRLAEAAKSANVQITVTDVTAFGDSVNAKAKFIVNGQENIVDVPFVAEDGKWKVQKAWSCTMLTNLGQQSVACG